VSDDTEAASRAPASIGASSVCKIKGRRKLCQVEERKLFISDKDLRAVNPGEADRPPAPVLQ
jgi:hypothetical protein